MNEYIQFLQSAQLGESRVVTDFSKTFPGGASQDILLRPKLSRYCGSQECKKEMNFQCTSDPNSLTYWQFSDKDFMRLYQYTCSHCQDTKCFIWVRIQIDKNFHSKGQATKLGEWPPNVPPTPRKLLNLLGEAKSIFLSGRRCETQGMGIGAMTYYRRVIESIYFKLLDEIIRVAEVSGTQNESVELLKNARNEKFSKSVEIATPAIPTEIYINGNNPLPILYNHTSDKLHNYTDEECLATAQATRTVLVALAQRLDAILKDSKAAADAINALSSRSPKK